MSKELILGLLLSYFVVLMLISFLTSRKSTNDTFFLGNRNSKWYVVAFGMIGASLSGVTFISIPGTINDSHFTYLQMALGYIIGYIIIAFVLIPLYYKFNLTSIYAYLKDRFGIVTYKMGAAFFILSRLIGAALRMYLVVNVLQTFVFDAIGVPFELTVGFSILLIWVYTFRAGIKTIIWTDTLQTLFMLIAVGLSIYFIADDLNQSVGELYNKMSEIGMNQMWQTEDPNAANYWIKGILAGMFITLGMTGVDQDMMQKNLSCKNQKEAKWNMLSFSVVLFFVNVLFVFLGGLLYLKLGADAGLQERWASYGSDGDLLFATVALKGNLGLGVGLFFLLGLIAAAYSSADSALTSLTTSLSVDFLNVEQKDEQKQLKIRRMSHIVMSFALLLTILIFKYVKSDNVVWELFKAAQYTYGPLLGLFMFGVLTKRRVYDIITLPICIIVPLIIFLINMYSAELFGEFKFGSELLGLNAGLVFMLLWIFSKKRTAEKENF
jgi:SSS family solute:Na+ symporter